MHRNNVCHEFLLSYLGHSMKSRRSRSIRIQCFFNRRTLFNRKLNRFLQRSRNAMTVNVSINISNTVVKAAQSDRLNKDLFVFLKFRIPQKKDVTNKRYLCSRIVPPSLICGYAKLLVENVCSVLQSTH